MKDNAVEMMQMCEIPISPDELGHITAEAIALRPHSFLNEHRVIPVQSVSIKPICLVAILEAMKAITAGVDFNKKARIVLEYDPDKRMKVTVFRAAEDLEPEPDREKVPKYLLRPDTEEGI